MVHGVGDDDRAVVQEREALRFVEGDRVGRAVLEAAGAGADPPDDRLAVRRQLDQLVPGGVADQEGAAGPGDRLAGEAQHGGLGLRRHVRAVAAAKGALRRVLGLQLRHQALDGVRVALARVLCDDVALRVDDDERRPGADGVLLPGGELRVVQDRVLHAVALDRVRDRPVLGLVHELREWTPMITTVSRCFSSSSRSSSRTCRQLMQQKVQKSRMTMRPRRSARVYCFSPVFSQPPLPVSSGARTRARRGVGAGVASVMDQECHPPLTVTTARARSSRPRGRVRPRGGRRP